MKGGDITTFQNFNGRRILVLHKKVIIISITVVLIIIATILGTIATFVLSKNKNKPEDIWQKYIACINEQKYEEMYNMLTEDSKAKIIHKTD